MRDLGKPTGALVLQAVSVFNVVESKGILQKGIITDTVAIDNFFIEVQNDGKSIRNGVSAVFDEVNEINLDEDIVIVPAGWEIVRIFAGKVWQVWGDVVAKKDNDNLTMTLSGAGYV